MTFVVLCLGRFFSIYLLFYSIPIPCLFNTIILLDTSQKCMDDRLLVKDRYMVFVQNFQNSNLLQLIVTSPVKNNRGRI